MAEPTDAAAASPPGDEGPEDIVKGPPAHETARFVRVGTADDPFEADLLADSLDEAGIPVLARARRDAPLDTLVSPDSPWWELLVPEDLQERATAIVAARRVELDASSSDAEQAAVDEEKAGEEKEAAEHGGEKK